jgi:hypothetical protein
MTDRIRAYQAGARVARDRMAADAPLDAAALADVTASDIVVVEGCYDHVQQVLEALDMPFTMVDAAAVARLRLRPEQLLVINCPGNIGDGAIPKVRDFVADGGSLFTTDWALRHVLEPAFPGVVAFNDRATADDVVRIEVKAGDNPFLAGVMDGADDPLWWLEGASYPIRVLDPERVQVLITSAEMASKYGEAAIAVHFDYGKGEVLHMVSHYYLQRTELRTARHAAPAASYAAEKGIVLPAPMVDGLTLADVQSAQTSARLLANVVARKKRGKVDSS